MDKFDIVDIDEHMDKLLVFTNIRFNKSDSRCEGIWLKVNKNCTHMYV